MTQKPFHLVPQVAEIFFTRALELVEQVRLSRNTCSGFCTRNYIIPLERLVNFMGPK